MGDFENAVKTFKDEVSRMTDKSRGMWDRKAANLQDDLASIQRDANRFLGAYFKVKKEEDDRNKLFDGARQRAPDDDEQALAKEHSSLSQSAAMLDDIIGQGTGTLGQLMGQNKTLKA